MEGKYGRLFTEGDVKKMLRLAVLEGAPSPEEQIAEFDRRGELTFPADEPLFLLRGQDKAAPGTITGYLMCANAAGASIEHASAARKAGRAMAEWQAEHPDRVKVPD